MLARSSLPSQRAAACRLLGAVLARARPTPADALSSLVAPACRTRLLEALPGVGAPDVRCCSPPVPCGLCFARGLGSLI